MLDRLQYWKWKLNQWLCCFWYCHRYYSNRNGARFMNSVGRIHRITVAEENFMGVLGLLVHSRCIWNFGHYWSVFWRTTSPNNYGRGKQWPEKKRLQRHAVYRKHSRGKDINSDMRKKQDYLGLLFVASVAEGIT